MANKRISELEEALNLQDSDLLVIVQNSATKKITVLKAKDLLKGKDGINGKDGKDGLPGPVNTITIGTVTKGEVASATLTGAPPNQILNLVLPKGETGEAGKSGVYVGEDEPQDPNVKVWIKENGEADENFPSDGISPTIEVNANNDTEYTLKITDSKGTIITPNLKGQNGADGKDGQNGSPGPANNITIGTVTKGEVASATLTGESPNQVLNLVLPKGDVGKQGPQGTPGNDGENGATFTPSVNQNGDLSWTNDKGLVNPPTINIKGPKGDAGEPGQSAGQEETVTDVKTFSGFSNLYDSVELDDNNVIIDEISFNSIFVSPQGNNTTGNGSKNKPFKTIAKALNTVKAGQTIWIREGTYTENIVFNKSGEEGNHITLRNYPNEVAKIDLTGKTTEAVIDFNSKSYINVIGLELCNLTQQNDVVYGVLMRGGETNCIIANCNIHNITAKSTSNGDAHGIKIIGLTEKTSENILVQGNHIHDCVCGTSEALTIESNVKNVDVINNKIHDNGNIGIDVIGNFGENSNAALDFAQNIYIAENEVYNCHSNNADCAGLYVDGASNVIFARNKSYNNQVGLEIGAEEVANKEEYYPHNNLIINNLIYNNTVRQVALGGYSDEAGKTYNTFLWNNTIIHPESSTDVALAINVGEGFSIVNNIIIDLGTWNFLISGDYDNNYVKNYLFYNNLLYHANGEEIGNYINIADTTYNTTTFQDADFTENNIVTSNYGLNADYTLQEDSPAIEAGYYVEKMLEFLDLAGNTKEKGKIDIGCYKYKE